MVSDSSSLKNKRKLVICLLCFVLIELPVLAQFESKEIKLNTIGLSEEYSSLFKNQENVLIIVNGLNYLKIATAIKPITINVSFKDSKGRVSVSLAYNSIIEPEFRPSENGVSVLFPDQIFFILDEYKKSVAKKDYTFDKDLLEFESAVEFKKANGDFVKFISYNTFDIQGNYPHQFFINVFVQIGGKVYQAQATSNQELNERKYFRLGKTVDLSGEKTGAYYFCKFFSCSPGQN